jgi:hypothetical protein
VRRQDHRRLLPRKGLDPPQRRERQRVTAFTARDGYGLRRIALLGWSEAQRSEALRTEMRGYYQAFRARLAGAARAWQAAGHLAEDAIPEEVAKTLLATLLGFVVQSALLGDVTPEDLARGLARLREPAPPART